MKNDFLRSVISVAALLGFALATNTYAQENQPIPVVPAQMPQVPSNSAIVQRVTPTGRQGSSRSIIGSGTQAPLIDWTSVSRQIASQIVSNTTAGNAKSTTPGGAQFNPSSKTASRPVGRGPVRAVVSAKGKRRVLIGEFDLGMGRNLSRAAIGEATSKFIQNNRPQFGLENVDSDLLEKVRWESAGAMHVRYQKTYKGLPLWGEQLVVSEKLGNAYMVNGSFEETGEGIDLNTLVSDEAMYI